MAEVKSYQCDNCPNVFQKGDAGSFNATGEVVGKGKYKVDLCPECTTKIVNEANKVVPRGVGPRREPATPTTS